MSFGSVYWDSSYNNSVVRNAAYTIPLELLNGRFFQCKILLQITNTFYNDYNQANHNKTPISVRPTIPKF